MALRPLPLDPAGLLRTAAATAAFFALCVFATQTGNKLLGANIRYVDRAVNYHRDIIRAGPGLYLFNLVDEMLQSGNVFRYPLQINERTPELSLPAQPRAPRFDLVIVLQYESLWLDWQGRLCAPAPTLSLPASVAQWRKTIHSPPRGHDGAGGVRDEHRPAGGPAQTGVVPYYYLSDKVPGLARSAAQSGYQTLFAHPYVEKFWGRAKAIPALGYEERWFDTRFTALEHKGLYISDDALIDHLLKRSNQDDQPLFAYAVTMQGHGPFDGDRYRAQQRSGACPDQSPADTQLLNTYYTGVVDAMASPGAAAQDPGQLRQALPGGGLRGPPALPDVGGQGHPRRQTATGCQLPDPHDGLHPGRGRAGSRPPVRPGAPALPDGPGNKAAAGGDLTPSGTNPCSTRCSGRRKASTLTPGAADPRQLPARCIALID